MVEKKELNSILQNIEDEYRHDLALHLYSTFLLHQKDQLFPRRGWTSWPVGINEVPDPKNYKTYTLEDDYFDDRDNGQAVIPINDGEDDTEDVKVEDELSDQNINLGLSLISKRPSYDVVIEEELSSPRKNLQFELNAIFERKLRAKIEKSLINKSTIRKKKLNKTNDMRVKIKRKIQQIMKFNSITKKPIQQIIDPPVRLSEKFTDQIIEKLNETMENLVQNTYTSGNASTATASRHQVFHYRLSNWQDILNASYQLNSVELNHKLVHKFHRLFVNFKYEYQYDTEIEEEEEEDNDNAVEGEESNTDDSGKRNSRNTNDEDTQYSDNLALSRQLKRKNSDLDVETRLQKRKLYTEHLSQIKYNYLICNLKNQHLKKKKIDQDLQTDDYFCKFKSNR